MGCHDRPNRGWSLCWGFHNRVPQTGCLRITETCCLIVVKKNQVLHPVKVKSIYVLLTKWLNIREVSERGQQEKETQKQIFLQFWGLENKINMSGWPGSSGSTREGSALASLLDSGSSLACGSTVPLFSWHSPCVCVSGPKFSLLKVHLLYWIIAHLTLV